jgi:coproporphyrinogen III oxidase-like Fe-S oxidoreductase
MAATLLSARSDRVREFLDLGLIRQMNGNIILTRAGKSLADTVAEAFV